MTASSGPEYWVPLAAIAIAHRRAGIATNVLALARDELDDATYAALELLVSAAGLGEPPAPEPPPKRHLPRSRGEAGNVLAFVPR